MQRALVFCTAIAVAGCTSMKDAPPADPRAVIDERVSIMKGFVGALGASGAFVQGKGTAQAARAKVAPALTGMAKLEDLFPRGTALGDRGAGVTRALSTIFANRSDFEAKIDAASRALAGLDAALARESKADTTAAVNTAKTACVSCHNLYRTADE